MAHFFVSYSHKDKDYVHRLAKALQDRGFEVWIDDRIDYGTRWPLVIEDAIDSCQGLILVASEHSHEPEWVQHEVARAQRLHKPIFPLLLNGNPWLSFESTQYHSVQAANLPDQKFFDALSLSENNRFEYFRHMVTYVWSWPVYRNDDYGFSVNIPKEGKTSHSEPGFIQIDLPIGTGTNLDERSVMIHYRKDAPLESPVTKHLPWMQKKAYVNILGIPFLKEMGEEGGMSRYHEFVSYSASRLSNVVTISFHLAMFPADIFGDAPVIEVDRVAAKDVLSYVVSTFTWLD
jgi:TIR domain